MNPFMADSASASAAAAAKLGLSAYLSDDDDDDDEAKEEKNKRTRNDEDDEDKEGEPEQQEKEEVRQEMKLDSDDSQPPVDYSAYLPPLPTTPCNPDIQERVRRFLAIQSERGVSVNEQIQGNSGFRNPAFLEKMVEHFALDSFGTLLPAHVWDPHNLPREDFVDAIEQALAERRERRERERRELSTKLLG